MHRQPVHAVADFSRRIGHELRVHPAIDRRPRLPGVLRAKRAGGGDGNEYPLGIRRIDENRMETQSARARLPVGTGAVLAQARELLPVLTAVGRTKHRRVFDAGVDRVGIA